MAKPRKHSTPLEQIQPMLNRLTDAEIARAYSASDYLWRFCHDRIGREDWWVPILALHGTLAGEEYRRTKLAAAEKGQLVEIDAHEQYHDKKREAEDVAKEKPRCETTVKLLNLLDIQHGASLRAESTMAAARVANDLSEGMTQAERIAIHEFLTEVADAVRRPRPQRGYMMPT